MNKPNNTFEQQSFEAAEFLRTLGNPHRLQILCLLMDNQDLSVGQMNECLDLSQSALSQHLAKMREEGVLTYRRDAQTLYYRIADERVMMIMPVIKELFCPQRLAKMQTLAE